MARKTFSKYMCPTPFTKSLVWQFFLPAFFAMVFSSSAQGTGDSLQYLRPQDTLFAEVLGPGVLTFTHHYAKGQTLYSLAAHYGLKLDMLYAFNPSLRNAPTLQEGQPVAIPLPPAAIIKYWSDFPEDGSCAPVFYKVKRGDTFYGLAKRCFQIEMDTLLQRNGLTTFQLSPGMVLHIGWLSTHGIPETVQMSNMCGLPPPMSKYCLQFTSTTLQKMPQAQRGAAYWTRDVKASSDAIALHREAAIGSIIHLYNPRNQREAYARVIGRIDPRRYANDVIIIISPAVAEALGSKDARFFVEIEYFR